MVTFKSTPSLSNLAQDRLSVLGQNIRLARKARGWTQAEAAKRFLIGRATLQRLEQGDPSVSIGAYLAALDVMDLTDGVEAIGASHKDPILRHASIKRTK